MEGQFFMYPTPSKMGLLYTAGQCMGVCMFLLSPKTALNTTKAGLFFVRFSGKSKQVLVRNFELDHFEIELVVFLPELSNF